MRVCSRSTRARRWDGLFEAGGAGDGVAQRLGPGGERLQVAHGQAFLGRAARQAAPGEHEQHRARGQHRPAGDDEDERAGDDRDGGAGGQGAQQLAAVPARARSAGAARHAVQGEAEQEQAAADGRAGEHDERVEEPGRDHDHTSIAGS
jgi:hypothetical protein